MNGEQIIVSRFPIYDEKGHLIGAISTTVFDSLKVLDELKSEIERLRAENEDYRQQIEDAKGETNALDRIIGDSTAIMTTKREIEIIAGTDVEVLITGETGTGKELFANAIHSLSARRKKPYVKINCAAIPAELIESELFGYEAGAFSGANRQGKPGKFELANHGTILLDEIGETSMALQAKLLRAIQEKEIEKVGGTKPIKIDVRIICSTNRDLERMVREGKFREDLYYRINTMEIKIPPLRERKSDIPLLCERLIRENNLSDKMNADGISDEALRMLYRYDWRGNVRELKHVLERAGIMAQSGNIETRHLGFFIPKIQAIEESSVTEDRSTGSMQAKRTMLEKEAISKALEKFNGNKKKAAEYLEISRSTLYEKMKLYGL